MNLNNLIRKIIIILFIFLPIIFNPFGFDVFALPRAFFLYFIVFVLLIILFFQFIQNQKIEIKYTKAHLFLCAFLFFIFLSVIFAKDKYTAFWGYAWDYEGLFSWLCYFILFYIGFIYFREIKNIKKLFSILSLPILAVSLYAILQYFCDIQLMDWFQKTEIKRAFSFLGHPSYLGIYFILYLPLIFCLLITKELSQKLKFFFTITFIFGLVGLILSFSRGAWVAFFGMFILSLIFYRQKIKNYINKYKKISLSLLMFIMIFAVLLITEVIENGFINSVSQRFLSIFDFTTFTTQVRSILYRQSLLLIQDNWLLGIGPDNFVYVIPQYFLKYWDIFHKTVADKAHNQILDYLISFGIGGLISYLLFLFFWFKQSIGVFKKIDHENKQILQVIILAIIGYLITMQFHYSTIDLAPMFWFLLGIGSGIAVNAGIVKEKTKIILDANYKNWNFVKKEFYVFGFIIFCMLGYFAYQKISADHYFAIAAQNKVSPQNAISLLEIAINKNPRITNYYFVLNNYYITKGDYTKDYNNYQKAIDNLINANKYIPLDYKITYQLGDAYLKSANYAQNKGYVYEQAKKAYLQTLKLYPNSVDTHLKLGVVYANLNEEYNALAYWLQCADLSGNAKPECFYNLYALYNKRGEEKLAKKYYRKYLRFKHKLK